MAPQLNSRQPKHISPVSQRHIRPSVLFQMSETLLQIGQTLTLCLTSDKDDLTPPKPAELK